MTAGFKLPHRAQAEMAGNGELGDEDNDPNRRRKPLHNRGLMLLSRIVLASA